MQTELQAERPDLSISLLAVNLEGLESGLGDIAKVGDLPVLQDTAEVNAWGLWKAEWRDVIVADEANGLVTVYNLTTYDLAETKNYETLKALLIDAAD